MDIKSKKDKELEKARLTSNKVENMAQLINKKKVVNEGSLLRSIVLQEKRNLGINIIKLLGTVNEQTFISDRAKQIYKVIKNETLKSVTGTIPSFNNLLSNSLLTATERNWVSALKNNTGKMYNLIKTKSDFDEAILALKQVKSLELILKFSHDIITLYNSNEIEDIIQISTSKFSQVQNQLLAINHNVEAKEVFSITASKQDNQDFLDSLLNGESNDDKNIIPTGFNDYDMKVGGLYRDSLMLIGAVTGGGKSTMANQLCINTSKMGFKTIQISLEMDADEIKARTASNVSNVPFSDIKRKRLNSKQKHQIALSYTKFENTIRDNGGEYKLYTPPTLSSTQMFEYLEVSDTKYDIVVLDYINLLNDTDVESQAKVLSAIGRKAKEYAQKHHCVFIILVQIDEKEGTVRYSRALQEHADNFWTWGASLIGGTKVIKKDLEKEQNQKLGNYNSSSDEDVDPMLKNKVEIYQIKGRNQGQLGFTLDKRFEVCKFTNFQENLELVLGDDNEDDDTKKENYKKIEDLRKSELAKSNNSFDFLTDAENMYKDREILTEIKQKNDFQTYSKMMYNIDKLWEIVKKYDMPEYDSIDNDFKFSSKLYSINLQRLEEYYKIAKNQNVSSIKLNEVEKEIKSLKEWFKSDYELKQELRKQKGIETKEDLINKRFLHLCKVRTYIKRDVDHINNLCAYKSQDIVNKEDCDIPIFWRKAVYEVNPKAILKFTRIEPKKDEIASGNFRKYKYDILNATDEDKLEIYNKINNMYYSNKRKYDLTYDLYYLSLDKKERNIVETTPPSVRLLKIPDLYTRFLVLREEYKRLQTTLKSIKYKKRINSDFEQSMTLSKNIGSMYSNQLQNINKVINIKEYKSLLKLKDLDKNIDILLDKYQDYKSDFLKSMDTGNNKIKKSKSTIDTNNKNKRVTKWIDVKIPKEELYEMEKRTFEKEQKENKWKFKKIKK